MGFSKLVNVLPSRQYLKLYLWIFSLVCLILTGISFLIGRYLGYELAAIGMGAILLMLVLAFSGALLAGVLLQIIDR